ncbi:uncharacterized protein LOC122721999 [Manihot esculenta]|uniref:Uncharacterized protein n=1 Tax=Manihot esculenta TaxID=3983 RepID=A0A2C9UH32_MANES|nr:uncharacterized protein LOC122721999 [Manihot esculenta]OAY29921.1 hypothetical protein MANES_15G182300v8 [Manihot esculenta]
MAKPSSRSQKSLKDALIQKESPNTTPRVVIVMDALREFSIDPLRWALENIIPAGCVVTLLGIMPWLNIPLSSKTQEVWALELEEVFMAQDTNEPKMDPKLLKLKQVVDLCETFGVVLQKEVVMGFPLKWMVVEKITSLHATWVVFDRYQKRKRRFFAHRIPCSMVIMNENSEADMIKGQPMIDNGELTPTPFSLIPTPQLIISDGCKAGQGQINNHIMRN